MKPLLAIPVILAGITLPVATSASMTAQELCQKVYEQYGLRSDGCDDDDAAPASAPAPTTGSAASLTDEMQQDHVFFAGGGTRLDDRALARLSALVKVLEMPLMQGACLRLVGHSDSSGPAERNLEISRQRAEVVAGHLRARLADPTRIHEVLAEGERRGLPGFPPQAAENRRVEILARTCPPKTNL